MATTTCRWCGVRFVQTPKQEANYVHRCAACKIVKDMAWRRSHGAKPPVRFTADGFWARVDKSGECWIWKRGHDGAGYGQVSFNGRVERVHRVAWELTHGPIPAGLFCCHRCDNPPCCNPAHLFLGTHSDNMRDAVKKGRHVSGFIVTGRDERGRAIPREPARPDSVTPPVVAKTRAHRIREGVEGEPGKVA